MERLLVATDFSLPADNAVSYAANLAKFFSAELVLVHAYTLPVGSYDTLYPLNLLAETRSYAEGHLNTMKEELIRDNYDFGITCFVGPGTVHDIVKEALSLYPADLIIMGMVGDAGKIKEHLIGSNTLHLSKKFDLPILVVPEGVTYQKIQRVGLAYDMDGGPDDQLLYSARDLAQIFNAELEVVTVKKSEEGLTWNSPENYTFIDQVLKNVKHKNVHISDKRADLALEYYFKFHETDLILVKPRKLGIFQTLFSGSLTKHLAFHIQVPLLIIH